MEHLCKCFRHGDMKNISSVRSLVTEVDNCKTICYLSKMLQMLKCRTCFMLQHFW